MPLIICRQLSLRGIQLPTRGTEPNILVVCTWRLRSSCFAASPSEHAKGAGTHLKAIEISEVGPSLLRLQLFGPRSALPLGDDVAVLSHSVQTNRRREDKIENMRGGGGHHRRKLALQKIVNSPTSELPRMLRSAWSAHYLEGLGHFRRLG